jgi:Fur family transcriptional regulator, ferric uptake regulator
MADRKEYNTKTKDKIISFLIRQKGKTLSTKEIYYYLKANDVNIDLSTVYRNLEVLHEDGIVQKFYNSNGRISVYQYIEKSGNCHEHLHIQCIKCGKLLHLNCEYMNGVLDDFKGHLYVHHKFSLEIESSMLYGVCDSCKQSTII